MLGGANAGLTVRISSPDGFDPQRRHPAGRQAAGGRDRRRDRADHRPAGRGRRRRRRGHRHLDVDGAGERRAGPGRAVPAVPGQRRSCSAAPADDAIVLHCLPAHRGWEITDEVLDGPQSAVWDEAENRLHAQKSLMVFLIAAVRDSRSRRRDDEQRACPTKAARHGRITELIRDRRRPVPDRARGAAGRQRISGHPGHAVPRSGGARRDETARRGRRRARCTGSRRTAGRGRCPAGPRGSAGCSPSCWCPTTPRAT